jgi:hypothetical protein
MCHLPQLHLLNTEYFLKLIYNLMALQTQHNEVRQAILVNNICEFVITSRASTPVANDVCDIRNTDGLIPNISEERFITGWILAESSALPPKLARSVNWNRLSCCIH